MNLHVSPDNENLEYCGRIDFSDKKRPVMVWAASYVQIKFKGTAISVTLQNQHDLWTNQMGYILDGKEEKLMLYDGQRSADGVMHEMEEVWSDQENTYVLEENLDPSVEHNLMLFKRQDSCHYVTFAGFEIENGEILPIPQRRQLKIEVYGDSVSNGEVSEIEGYEGKEDPENHFALYNNAYQSYAWILARMLDAKLHDVSQGGIALLDNTGYFHPKELVGVLKTWDKLRYNPNPLMGKMTSWNFKLFTPDIVIVAIGQNDAHPEDYMATDYNGDKAEIWRNNYEKFIKKIRSVYKEAHIILMTTVLIHDKSWDDSIEEVYKRLLIAGEDRNHLHHFIFEGNGAITPGHIRRSEAEQMAYQLKEYIETLN